MTRRRDLMLEDLFECKHEAEIPIVSEYGEILHWRCHCGRRVADPATPDPATPAEPTPER